MKLSKLIAIVLIVLSSTFLVQSVIIVPAPTVTVTEVTTTSIALNWTMPPRELHDFFTLEVELSEELILFSNTNLTETNITDLRPGFIYSFIVTATRGNLTSDQSVIYQDTVPLSPTNLTLEVFQSLILSLDGVFGEVQFTLEFPGIEATWNGPERGVCDCYEAIITPPDGKVARPVPSDTVLPECLEAICQAPLNATTSRQHLKSQENSVPTIRKFIELTPGQTYTVAVRSTTCGHGFSGPLKSSFINSTIVLPPAHPPLVFPKYITNTTVYLSWEKGEIQGIFDGFEVVPINTNSGIVVHPPLDPRERGRNISGLLPCTNYEFEVFTLNKGLRSINNRSVEFSTRPSPPHSLMVTGFNESFIGINWKSYSSGNKEIFFQIDISNLFILTKPATVLTANLTQLRPGTLYNISVHSQCSDTRSKSILEIILQATIPLRPESVTGTCVTRSTSNSFENTAFSTILLSWLPPTAGDWDGFIIDYSPFLFDNLTVNSSPPLLVSKEARSLNVTVPVRRHQFTTYVRSVKNHVLSSAAITNTDCGNFDQNVHRQCRIRSTSVRILVKAFNSTHLYVEVSGTEIINITIQLSDVANDVFVTTLTSFYVINPCKLVVSASSLNLIVYPACEPGRSCLPIRRKLCVEAIQGPESLRVLLRTANACCNGRPYNTIEQKCCHGKLENIHSLNHQCCYTRWFDSTRQKCCGNALNGNGIIRAITRPCFD